MTKYPKVSKSIHNEYNTNKDIDMSVLAVRMSDDMKQHLEFIASHFQRSKNFIAVDALKDYIANKMIEI